MSDEEKKPNETEHERNVRRIREVLQRDLKKQLDSISDNVGISSVLITFLLSGILVCSIISTVYLYNIKDNIESHFVPEKPSYNKDKMIEQQNLYIEYLQDYIANDY